MNTNEPKWVVVDSNGSILSKPCPTMEEAMRELARINQLVESKTMSVSTPVSIKQLLLERN